MRPDESVSISLSAQSFRTSACAVFFDLTPQMPHISAYDGMRLFLLKKA
jgi:hypothetical protein